MKNRKELAKVFDALGHYRRISIFVTLQKAGPSGLPFGDLALLTAISESNLAHHIRMMKRGGVIIEHRQGRRTILTSSLLKSAPILALLGLSVAK